MSKRPHKPRPNQKSRRKSASGVRAGVSAAAMDVVIEGNPSGLVRLRRVSRRRGFRWSLALLLAGILPVVLSLSIPHDFAFFELGYLFTLSVYDLVLAMLGISFGLALLPRDRQVAHVIGAFLAVIVPMMLFFDPIFSVILQSPLGHEMFLIAPVAVMLTGAALWLPERLRFAGLVAATMVVSFSLSLFIGLDDFGIGLKDFTTAAVLAAVWILLAPGLMLRQFRDVGDGPSTGPSNGWLVIPARIVGSWLVVIGTFVLVSLYVPILPGSAPPQAPDSYEDGVRDTPSMNEIAPLPEDDDLPQALPEDDSSGGNPLFNRRQSPSSEDVP